MSFFWHPGSGNWLQGQRRTFLSLTSVLNGMTLHHIMVRGIERTKLFRGDPDGEEFLRRIPQLVDRTETKVLDGQPRASPASQRP